MQKVVFSVTKSGKFSTKSTGIGYIDNENLYVPALSQKGKPYIRVFNCIKNCHQITNRPDEFKGEHYEIREVEIETKTQQVSTPVLKPGKLKSPTTSGSKKYQNSQQ